MLILANSRSVLGQRTSGRASNVFVGIALILMTILPLLYVIV